MGLNAVHEPKIFSSAAVVSAGWYERYTYSCTAAAALFAASKATDRCSLSRCLASATVAQVPNPSSRPSSSRGGSSTGSGCARTTDAQICVSVVGAGSRSESGANSGWLNVAIVEGESHSHTRR